MSTCVNDTNGDGNCAACAQNPEAPCRKSAGDALKIALMESVGVVKARAMVDAYAHELAEKIRNSERLRNFTDDHVGDCDEAADEIDPEVASDG